jgi:CheY-like chemotaxis protein
MTDGAGIELLKMIRRSPNSPNPFLPVMMVTAFSEEQRVYSALREGATCYLKKPISAASFYQKFMFCLEDRREFEQTENYFGPELGALDFEDVVFDDA